MRILLKRGTVCDLEVSQTGIGNLTLTLQTTEEFWLKAKKACDFLQSRLNSLLTDVSSNREDKITTRSLLQTKIYMVSEKEVGCDDVVPFCVYFYYRTRVRSLVMLVTDSLTH